MSKKKIVVLNGSPKGENSITLQTVLYIQKRFPEHEFIVLPVASRIHSYEKDMTEAIEKLKSADFILFSYPVYTFLVPSQLHRFIELLKEENVDLSGKYVSQISTSKHFFDVIAHRFIEENCKDLGMTVIRGLSADMEDLTKKKGQKQAYDFFKYVLWNMGEDVSGYQSFAMQKAGIIDNVQKPVVIVTDVTPENTTLSDMIARFREVFTKKTEVVNIRQFQIKGGCLGCLRCSSSGKCIYTDGFSELLRERIQGGCAIIYAFTIKDHSMGSYFKMYDDRQFCNGHRTVTMGSPIGYIVSGDLSKEQNLKLMLEARAEAGGNFLAGFATNETDIEESIQALAKNMTYALDEQYAPPSNFLGVGGMKIFRDLIYQMRGIMKEDHKFFKENGQYDFPHNRKGTILAMYLVGAMFSSEKMMKKMGNKMTEGMLMPYKKVLDEMDKK